MVESKIAKFKMAAIIMLSQNEWVKYFLCKLVGTNLGKCEWVWEEKLKWLNPRWWNSSWQNSRWLLSSNWVRKMSEVLLCIWLNRRWQHSRWLPSSSSVRMNEFESDWIRLSQSFVQNGWIQDGSIQDGCHHQVRWEWMSLSQIELVCVRVRVEWECFWVNLREDNKVSESKMTVFESNRAEF